MTTQTDLMVLEVPILDDETVDALHTFLEELLTQFEDHYFYQLRTCRLARDARDRDPLEPWNRVAPNPVDPKDRHDEDLDDEIPF